MMTMMDRFGIFPHTCDTCGGDIWLATIDDNGEYVPGDTTDPDVVWINVDEESDCMCDDDECATCQSGVGHPHEPIDND